MRLLSALLLLFSAAVASAVVPGPVNGLTATAGANKSIVVTWTAPTVSETAGAATTYEVSRSTAASPNPVVLTTTPISQLTYTDSSSALVVGTQYVYSVVAINTDGRGQSTAAAPVTPKDIPGGPANLRATRITDTTVSLQWNLITGDDITYNVYREDENDPIAEDLTTTTFTDTGLTKNTEYTYFVTANTDEGESGDSNSVTVTTGDGNGRTALVRRFRQIDIDASGLLSFSEFVAGQGGRLAWVVMAHRFEYSDTDGSGDLSVVEYSKSIGGRKFGSPSKPRQFYLADLPDVNGDRDDLLTFDEFALTRSPRTKQAALEKSFNKLNTDGEDGLSPLEMKLRNYVLQAPLGGDEEEEAP